MLRIIKKENWSARTSIWSSRIWYNQLYILLYLSYFNIHFDYFNREYSTQIKHYLITYYNVKIHMTNSNTFVQYWSTSCSTNQVCTCVALSTGDTQKVNSTKLTKLTDIFHSIVASPIISKFNIGITLQILTFITYKLQHPWTYLYRFMDVTFVLTC